MSLLCFDPREHTLLMKRSIFCFPVWLSRAAPRHCLQFTCTQGIGGVILNPLTPSVFCYSATTDSSWVASVASS
ncbi:hypothetical protein SISSUDRAFT_1050938 [Sistotremastrum suecicum HHB10207 ss-3]|uniref:Uncharacterized protein n=1 Tax=Sistotremastrum suecicum HHB10207 ss-3 TaxID=1314776 RepID=A0A166AW44_9AGAM|nr:hypothetical protein SISSUDRAFT_1050938 [Sistotremastrum suecicum HHB10207 ss-3]